MQNPSIVRRRRSSSVKEVLSYIQSPPNQQEHHILHLQKDIDDDKPTPLPPSTPRKKKVKTEEKSTHFLQSPLFLFKIITAILGLYLSWEILFNQHSQKSPRNYLDNVLFLSYKLKPDLGTEYLGEEARYGKGLWDLSFLAFYVVVFSFFRQFVTIWIMKPFALSIGIKKGKKLERFMEQGYAVVYFSASSIFGLYVMSKQASWWYKTEEFFLNYPHGGVTSKAGGMTALVKSYYLLQLSYWLQQALVMIVGLEAPRDDFVELILHHVITLWLVSVSYWVNATQVGIGIFVSMDIPDVVLAFSKCISYSSLPEMVGNCSFVVFIFAWGYLRHYQNLRILYTVWNHFGELIPLEAQVWDPKNGYYMPLWMRYQVFTPIFLLQLVIGFWSYLILRILFKMLRGADASDSREEGEVETDG